MLSPPHGEKSPRLQFLSPIRPHLPLVPGGQEWVQGRVYLQPWWLQSGLSLHPEDSQAVIFQK